MASSPVSDTNNNQEVGGRFVPQEHDSLQRHVAFFDRNHDGIVYPWETFQGFRAIGCGILLSSFSAIFINFGLSRQTRPNKTRVDHIVSATDEYDALLLYEVQGKSFSLLFPIEVRNIHKAKHGSDSGVYDSDGRFVPSKFEEIFIKHAHTNANALTSEELDGLLKANREPNDRRGWLAAWTEWKILYLLCKDKNGLLHKDTIRAVYDGSLFERMEKERSEAAAAAAKKKDIA